MRLGINLGYSQRDPVVEGWYGMPFGEPLARTREYVRIMRDIWRREDPVTSDGPHYPLPLRPSPAVRYDRGITGLGKPLKSITHPVRPEIPVYLGAEGPRNIALAAEIAGGWLPLFVDPARIEPIFSESLRTGHGRRTAPTEDFDIAATVTRIVTEDMAAALELAKIPLAFYIGGMGARDRNFHLDLIGRLGYAEQAERVQELFLSGRRAEAITAVPDELADSISLLGPIARIGRLRDQTPSIQYFWSLATASSLVIVATSASPRPALEISR